MQRGDIFNENLSNSLTEDLFGYNTKDIRINKRRSIVRDIRDHLDLSTERDKMEKIFLTENIKMINNETIQII